MMAEKRKQGHSFWADYFPLILVGVAVLLVCLIIGPHRYYQRILLLVVLWMCICSNFNIISGYGGQIVFGYMLFVGAGGYTSVLLFKFLGVNPWVGMFVGATVAAFLAFVIGYPTLRLRGHYFAVATVAFPLMAIPIVAQLGWEEIHIPFAGRGIESMQFTDVRYYVLMGAILLVVFLIIVRMIERSRFGYALQALKQNEAAAEGMGIHTHRVKLLAFMLSAFLTGIVGTVYCFSILFLLTTPAAFGLFIIVRILSITIVGGIGTLWGPVIGAVLLVPVGEVLAAEVGDRWPGFQDLIYGVVLLIAVIYMPAGISGTVTEMRRRRKRLASARVQARVAPSDPNRLSNQGSPSSFKLGTSLPTTRGSDTQGPK